MPNSLHHTNALFCMISIRFLSGLYTRADTESKKDKGDKNRGVQKDHYFTVLTGPILLGMNDGTLNTVIRLLFDA